MDIYFCGKWPDECEEYDTIVCVYTTSFLSEAQASCSNTFTVYKQLSSISIHGGNSKAILKYVSDTV